MLTLLTQSSQMEYHILIELVESFAHKLFGLANIEPKRDLLEALLVLILQYAGSRLNWHQDTRHILKMYRSKNDNDYLQTIARKPIRVRVNQKKKWTHYEHRIHHRQEFYPNPHRRHRYDDSGMFESF